MKHLHVLLIYNENTLFIMSYHFIENKQTSKKETIQFEIHNPRDIPLIWTSTHIDKMAFKSRVLAFNHDDIVIHCYIFYSMVTLKLNTKKSQVYSRVAPYWPGGRLR